MLTIRSIIDDLGGPTIVAAEIAVPMTTVHSWVRNDYVPTWRIPALTALAKKARKPITATSFPTARPKDRAPQDESAAA